MPAVRDPGPSPAQPLLVVALGLAAAVPVIASTITAIANNWIPLGDDAVIAVRAYDVFSAHTPLLGQYSAASGLSGGTSHSLGPMLYWLLAVPLRVGGSTGLLVAMCVLNTAAVMGSVALAHRRGGPGLAAATGIGLALVCASLPPETLHSVWNPSAGQLPLVLLVYLCWSLACGEIRLLALSGARGQLPDAVSPHLRAARARPARGGLGGAGAGARVAAAPGDRRRRRGGSSAGAFP